MNAKLVSNRVLVLFAVLHVCFAANLFAQNLPDVKPEEAGMSSERLAFIDGAVNGSIERKETPGAVVLIGRKGKIVFRKAYGKRSIKPSVEEMTTDTVFDLASLTKPLATATSVMILIEKGKLRLNDRIGKFIPEIEDETAKSVRIEQLLTHTSGYRPDFDLGEKWTGRDGMLAALKIEKLRNPPGSKFVYSDIGFIVLGEIIERVTGKPLNVFAAENQFGNLRTTGFFSTAGKIENPKIAPTEDICGQQRYLGGSANPDCDSSTVLRGHVHDPTAYRMGGTAGHAGLFSTVDELAMLCDMFLSGGTLNGKLILSPASIAEMTKPRSAADGGFRGLGWDIDTRFSSNRGDLFPVGSFGHTGFTGTSVWMDPASGVFVVFLSNRVHPDGKGDVGAVRGQVASIAAASITDVSVEQFQRAGEWLRQTSRVEKPVKNGIDVLKSEKFERLKGLKIGLVTNHTGRDFEGNPTIDILFDAKETELKALFSPEHGIRGELDQAQIDDTKDVKTGLPVYSLYGKSRRPTPEQLKDLDALVFDIQDIGTRFYTYISTLRYVLEEAKKSGVKVFVLDRPNPITGVSVEGPLADEENLSFVAAHTIPVRHGMTVGELALMMNAERGIDAKLEIVKMDSWKRSMWFDETGQIWVNPSPNMRSLTEALLYPGIGLLETTNLSVGRGTDTPFEVFGAPWIDGQKLAALLNSRGLPGVRFVPLNFTPKSSVFKEIECSGVNVIVTDRKLFMPLRTGYEIALILRGNYQSTWEIEKYSRLLANDISIDLVRRNAAPGTLEDHFQSDVRQFLLRRANYLLY